ncbi:MAG: hypothetical protein V2A66_05550 [Pseudomonadota bacterium]
MVFDPVVQISSAANGAVCKAPSQAVFSSEAEDGEVQESLYSSADPAARLGSLVCGGQGAGAAPNSRKPDVISAMGAIFTPLAALLKLITGKGANAEANAVAEDAPISVRIERELDAFRGKIEVYQGARERLAEAKWSKSEAVKRLKSATNYQLQLNQKGVFGTDPVKQAADEELISADESARLASSKVETARQEAAAAKEDMDLHEERLREFAQSASSEGDGQIEKLRGVLLERESARSARLALYRASVIQRLAVDQVPDSLRSSTATHVYKMAIIGWLVESDGRVREILSEFKDDAARFDFADGAWNKLSEQERWAILDGKDPSLFVMQMRLAFARRFNCPKNLEAALGRFEKTAVGGDLMAGLGSEERAAFLNEIWRGFPVEQQTSIRKGWVDVDVLDRWVKDAIYSSLEGGHLTAEFGRAERREGEEYREGREGRGKAMEPGRGLVEGVK